MIWSYYTIYVVYFDNSSNIEKLGWGPKLLKKLQGFVGAHWEILLSTSPTTHHWLQFSAIFLPQRLILFPRLPWTYSGIHHLLSVYLTTALPPSFLRSLPLQCFGCSPVAMKSSQQWPLSVREHRSKRNAYLMMAWCNKGKRAVSSHCWTFLYATVLLGCQASVSSSTPGLMTSPLCEPLCVLLGRSLQSGSVSHRILRSACSHNSERVDVFICWQLFMQTFVHLTDLLVWW